jgi:hypothetical protein
MESNDGKAKWAWSGDGGGALLASSSYLISIIITAGIDGVLALVSVFLPRLRRARRGAARRWDWSGIQSSGVPGWLVALRCNLQLAAAAVESSVGWRKGTRRKSRPARGSSSSKWGSNKSPEEEEEGEECLASQQKERRNCRRRVGPLTWCSGWAPTHNYLLSVPFSLTFPFFFSFFLVDFLERTTSP